MLILCYFSQPALSFYQCDILLHFESDPVSFYTMASTNNRLMET